jgi:hypothetical protein
MTRITKLFIANLFLKALDLFSTYLVVDEVGSVAEANPLVREAMVRVGTPVYFILFALFLGVALVALRHRLETLLWVIGTLMALVVLNNFLCYLWVIYGWIL